MGILENVLQESLARINIVDHYSHNQSTWDSTDASTAWLCYFQSTEEDIYDKFEHLQRQWKCFHTKLHGRAESKGRTSIGIWTRPRGTTESIPSRCLQRPRFRDMLYDRSRLHIIPQLNCHESLSPFSVGTNLMILTADTLTSVSSDLFLNIL